MPRTIHNNLITSDAQPSIRIQVEAALDYIGRQTITIHDVAEAELFIFAQTDDQQRIQRQLVVQFEHFLDSAPPERYRYNYQTPHTVTLDGQDYMTDTRIVPSHLYSEPDDPKSDRMQLEHFLTERGYVLPYYQDQTVTKRIMRVLGDERRAELLFIYKEPLLPPGLLTTSEEDTFLVMAGDLPKLADFTARALASFAVKPHPSVE